MAHAPQPQPMTEAQYLDLDRATPDARYEYYAGYVRLMAGGSPQHALVSMNIGTALNNALRDSPCRVFTSDARVQIASAQYVYPDVTVSCAAEDSRDPIAIRVPRVVFEVLSPSTEKFDRNQKANAYRACASIDAYVLVDQAQLSVEVYQRVGPFWQHFLYNTPDAVIDIAPLSIRIPIGDLYRGIDLAQEPPGSDGMAP